MLGCAMVCLGAQQRGSEKGAHNCAGEIVTPPGGQIQAGSPMSLMSLISLVSSVRGRRALTRAVRVRALGSGEGHAVRLLGGR